MIDSWIYDCLVRKDGERSFPVALITEQRSNRTEIREHLEKSGLELVSVRLESPCYTVDEIRLLAELTAEQRKVIKSAQRAYAVRRCEEMGIPMELALIEQRRKEEQRTLGDMLDTFIEENRLVRKS